MRAKAKQIVKPWRAEQVLYWTVYFILWLGQATVGTGTDRPANELHTTLPAKYDPSGRTGVL